MYTTLLLQHVWRGYVLYLSVYRHRNLLTLKSLDYFYERACVTVSDSELNVLLKEGSRITTLWWLARNNDNLWHHSNVMIGRIPRDFTLLFEASSNFNKPEYVAVDDVDFTNCSFPGRQPVVSFVCLFLSS